MAHEPQLIIRGPIAGQDLLTLLDVSRICQEAGLSATECRNCEGDEFASPHLPAGLCVGCQSPEEHHQYVPRVMVLAASINAAIMARKQART